MLICDIFTPKLLLLMNKKALVYNIMQFPDKIKLFNDGIQKEAYAVGIEVEYFVPFRPGLFRIIDDFTHLIISGSEVSARADMPWTEELTRLINIFVKKVKKILGICYGHQFMARSLSGKECVFKLPVPEYGYTKVRLTEHKLFNNITDPVCLQLHHDAVRNLPEDFKIIAENDTCIQAYQYKGMDIYGLQFHPEFGPGAAGYFLDMVKNADPDFPNFYKNDLKDESMLEQNGLFIRNFLGL